MKFKKLSKEKQKQLLGVAVLTLAVLAAMGHFLIQGGYRKLSQLEQKKQDAEIKLEKMVKTVEQSSTVEATFKETEALLGEKEKGMASGDLYSWMHSTLRRFQRNYDNKAFDIPQIGAVTQPEDVDLLPSFPYKQTSVSVAGTGYYHDIGRFIADFENSFPLMRVVNLSLDLNSTPSASDRDKLAFRMDIVALVKPQ